MLIICLGTASCYPTSTRSVSCTALRFEDGDVWIFDCGEGSQVQLQKSSVRSSRITKIFITHLHGDHLFGLPGLMCTIGVSVPERKDFVLEIYGPRGLRKYIRNTLILSKSALTYDYVVHEMIPMEEQFPDDWNTWPSDDEATGTLHPQEILGKDICADQKYIWDLFENENVCVKAGPITHSIPSFGFVVMESDKPGKLDVTQLIKLGVLPGPIYSRIKKGETITLPSGVSLKPEQVLGPPKLGRKITILGDTCNTERITDLAKSSDIVLHEATNENSMEEKAIDMGHSTPRMAARFAERVGARILMLYHFSQRYKTSPDNKDDLNVNILLEEAQQELSSLNCNCQVMLADDLLEYTVSRPIN
ncbi:hypothetical protein L9F63_016180 [Diploptera punctata]|uniref:Uncharacterized protein n=1 Tax=Diploptera punctata TaxID=6984 RepID=A0AAD8A1H8_DIPPU|nr:hypothetical protein L9F63_016180 [Diploptera punctata]